MRLGSVSGRRDIALRFEGPCVVVLGGEIGFDFVCWLVFVSYFLITKALLVAWVAASRGVHEFSCRVVLPS